MVFSVYRPLSHKIFYHWDKVIRGISDSKTPPITLDIDLTTACQSRCPNCTFPERRSKPPQFLPLDLAKDILEQSADFGIKAITYTGGGDPLLHGGLAGLLRYGADLGLENGLITNGVGFTKKKAEEMLPYLTWVRFSVDAGSPQVYRISHGLGARAFYQVLRNMEKAVEFRRQRGLITGISMSYLLFENNPMDFMSAAKIAKWMGLDFIQFKPMHKPDYKVVGQRCFDIEKLNRARPALEKLKASAELGDRMMLARFANLTQRNHKRCHAQQWTTSVGSDGKLYICCEYKYNPRYLLGDLNENTLAEIWQSEHRMNVINSLDVSSNCFLGCKLQAINNELQKILLDLESEEGMVEKVKERYQALLQATNGRIPAGINFI